jgi:hypothetical protein
VTTRRHGLSCDIARPVSRAFVLTGVEVPRWADPHAGECRSRRNGSQGSASERTTRPLSSSPLTLWAIGDLDVPALLLERVVDEPGTGHRLDHGADGLSVDLVDATSQGPM